jgi:tRNA modification GTPase
MHRSVERNSLENTAKLEERVIVQGENIAAISTPTGEGAIAIVRVSGADALGLADKIFVGQQKPSQFAARMQHLGEIVADDQVIDQVVISVHRTPASYTGEDLVEISCHGGMLITARVLETCLRAGARGARPGEFTERAFLNGKMDLTQAEAVIDLIRARTDLALRSATEQLEGRLGEKIRQIQEELIATVAHIEASIDFPEEGIAPDEGEKLRVRLDSARQKISQLLSTAEQGRLLREGVRVVIYGATNAGKSSLLNRLLGYERVIVSASHGTTRDAIEEVINLRGMPVRLLDTAGLRSSTDPLERAGIARTEKSLHGADLRLHIADSNAAKPPDFAVHSANGVEIVVLNKSDLPAHRDWENFDALRISCVTGEGLPDLENEILNRIAGENLRPESMLAINARHRDCLGRALQAIDRGAKSDAVEFLAIELRDALRAVGEVVGEVDMENILDSVFNQFCIGK